MTTFPHVVIDDLRIFRKMQDLKIPDLKDITYLANFDLADEWCRYQCAQTQMGEKIIIDTLYLDHDLGNGQDIIPIVRTWAELVQEGTPMPTVNHIKIITANGEGRKRIKSWVRFFCDDIEDVFWPEKIGLISKGW